MTSSSHEPEIASAHEARATLIAAAWGEASDAYTPTTPLVLDTQKRLFELIEGDSLPDEANSLQVKKRLLEAVGVIDGADEFVERGSGPYRLSELRQINDAISGTEQDASWGPIGFEEKSSSTPDREPRPVDPERSSKRYKALVALAHLGPGTASDIAERVERDSTFNVTRTTIEHELPRLFKQRMAGRSKRPSYRDVNTYWVTENGEELLLNNGNMMSLGAKHVEYQKLYGNE